MYDDSPHTTAPEPKAYTASSFSIRRPVTVAMVFLTLMVFGWKSYQELAINLMPDISYPALTVRTEYEGAAPADVEKLLTRPLEERLSIVSGVVEISSISSAGLSEIILEFTWETDMNIAMQDVRETLDLYDPPQGITEKPVILRYDPTLDPVMRVAISGNELDSLASGELGRLQASHELAEIREAAEHQIKSDLEAEPGIAQVVVKGGREEEIQILLDSARIKNLGLKPSDIVRSLEAQNINLSGGRLKEGTTEYLVRTLNEFQDLDEIRGVIVHSLNQGATGDVRRLQFRLDELASVRMGEREQKTIVRMNGREAVELVLYKEGDANIVQVCDMLKDFFGFDRKLGVLEKAMIRIGERMPSERSKMFLRGVNRKERLRERLRERLPKYARLTLITDQSRFIVASVNEVRSTAIIGGILALAILFVFLREAKTTIIVGIAIPISVVATFIPMFMRDISLNIMSLGGLALGVGMLVDNSIVVLESIHRCIEEGDDTVKAAERGTKEVASAVIASTLTTIAVFFPIVFVEGIAGQLFRDLALTVTFSLIASLLVALYLIPMIASRKGISVSEQDQVVWLIRGYREARIADGRGFLGAFLSLPAKAFKYALEGFRVAWNDTVGKTLGTMRGLSADSDGSPPSAALRIGSVLFFPVELVLFLLQLILRIAISLAVTLLFVMTLVSLGFFGVIAKILRLILYIPMRLFDYSFRGIRSAYGTVLRRSLAFSPLVLAGVAVLSVHAGQVSLGLGRELIPPMKQGEFGITLQTAPGTRLEDTAAKAEQMESIISGFAEVESVTVTVGNDDAASQIQEGENVATLTVKLANPDQTAVNQDQIMEEIRQKLAHSMADQITFNLPTLFSFNTAVELQIFGDELDQLRDLGNAVVAAIDGVAGLKDVELSLKPGYPEIQITLDRDLLATHKLSPSQVAEALRTEVQGDIATRFNRGGEKIDIRVRSDQIRLASLNDLKNLSVVDGYPPTPLGSVATIIVKEGPSEIRRIDQRQVVIVTANVEGRDLGSVARDIEESLARMIWPEGYSYILGGQNRELQTSYSGLLFAMFLAVFLVYVVMACQFESIWHPALIMFSVPLAFIGVVYVLQWQNISISIVVFIGGIVLAGVVVNDAIVLVDYINQLRARGMKKADAVVEAGIVRFRPILMTTMTTVLGLIPMALSTGEGAEIRTPMAITVMAGLCCATVLTLFIIPMAYNFIGRREA